MNKPDVLGKYVYIDIPIREEMKFQVDKNTKEELEKEFLKKLKKLQIWAVGDAANSKLKEGQWVLVDPEALRSSVKMVPFDINGKEIFKALILDYHIVHIWPEDE